MKKNVDKLRGKPWMDLPADVVGDITLPKGFVTDEERRSYYYLGRHWISGEGQIIDAGACLGASAYCFAAGLARNPARGNTLVHSYDRFLVYENYVADCIKQNFRPLQQEWGDDFYDIFEYQIGKYQEFVKPHRGDFMLEKWNGSPIELLFIDLAKTKDLHDHIVEQFFPSLVPAQSLVMHQDFYFSWLPYIHTYMQYLSHRFEVVDPLIPSASRLYLLKDAITSSEIEHARSMSPEERLDLLDKFIDGEKGDLRAMARVTKLVQLYLDENTRGYEADSAKFIAEFGVHPETAWGGQFAHLDGLHRERIRQQHDARNVMALGAIASASPSEAAAASTPDPVRPKAAPGAFRLRSPLKPHGFKVFSQTDEDGIIEAIFQDIPPRSRHFVEFGVGPNWLDKTYSKGLEGNCVLLRERGWKGLFMDGGSHPAHFDVKREFITCLNINGLLRKYDVPEDVDIVSIDVDGQDLWIWMALDFRPTLIIIEMNPNFTTIDQSATVAFDMNFRWDGTKYYGATLGALCKLGADKGYKLVYANGVNAFFVRSDKLANPEDFRDEEMLVFVDQHGYDHLRRAWVTI